MLFLRGEVSEISKIKKYKEVLQKLRSSNMGS